jgi:hypothetical protein
MQEYLPLKPRHNGSHPPFLIVYADKDFPSCDKMSEALCKALQDCKCTATSLKIDDRNHISIIRSMAREGDPATKAVLAFISRQAGVKKDLPAKAPAGGQNALHETR